jgi:hypothetical protein
MKRVLLKSKLQNAAAACKAYYLVFSRRKMNLEGSFLFIILLSPLRESSNHGINSMKKRRRIE